MIVTFLGTGTSQGIPVIACTCAVCGSSDPKDKRLRSSVYIEVDALRMVIDTGPDFRQQMLAARVQRLDAVLYTHQHKDHTAGLDDIRGFNFKHDMAMPLYGRLSVLKQIEQEFSYIFDHKHSYMGIPRVRLQAIENKPFSIGGLEIIPIEVMHHRLPVFGFRIGACTYITDASYIAPEEKEKIKGSRVLILNALRKESHLSHFTLSQAISLSQEMGAKQTYFTHISHLMGTHAAISQELPSGLALAHDGLRIQV